MTTIVTVHSMRGGVGKTTLSTSLARFLSSEKKKVLFIDFDIQSPDAHHFFDKKGSRHLFEDDLAEHITKINTQLDVLLFDPDHTTLARLALDNNHFKQMHVFLEHLKDQGKYDVVIIDTHSGISHELLLLKDLSDEILIVTDQNIENHIDISQTLSHDLDAKTHIIVNNVIDKKNKSDHISIPFTKKIDQVMLTASKTVSKKLELI